MGTLDIIILVAINYLLVDWQLKVFNIALYTLFLLVNYNPFENNFSVNIMIITILIGFFMITYILKETHGIILKYLEQLQ